MAKTVAAQRKVKNKVQKQSASLADSLLQSLNWQSAGSLLFAVLPWSGRQGPSISMPMHI